VYWLNYLQFSLALSVATDKKGFGALEKSFLNLVKAWKSTGKLLKCWGQDNSATWEKVGRK